MTSRRPMTRSFSGNGRTSSFNEEECSSSNGRSESRNTYLSNVRPENRSTLCSVMAQLTEDIQPSFESTLKSKAVSENCNVKFTCVVTGYPVPELKWYKDDMEMDRYCGLPKYEIHRNGKIHTLHIYNCTLDDAAIYQASASNCKGIVSCSGVLEVGTMNEYKIHQRFFDKLKQKAEKKKRDLEEKMEGKENIQKEQRSSPEHLQRKRSVPPLAVKAEVNQSGTVEQPAESNTGSKGMKKNPLESEASVLEEELAKKRLKMSNGVDAEVNSSSSNSRSHIMGHGGENCYDGGISLAQFLAETLQSQEAEENQVSPQEEKPLEVKTSVGGHKERDTEEIQSKLEEKKKELQKEHDKEMKRDEDLAVERDKSRERQVEMKQTAAHAKHSSEVKHHSKGHKDHDHHNIQASFSSMLHTVKDFFFGKSKKDSHCHTDDDEFDQSTLQPPKSDMPPSFHHNAETHEQLTVEVVPIEMDKTQESPESMDTEQHSASPELLKLNNEESVLHADSQPNNKPLPETDDEPASKMDDAVEPMEVSVEPGSSASAERKSLSKLQAQSEDEEKNSKLVSVFKEVPVQQQETHHQQPNYQAGGDNSSPKEDKSVMPQSHSPADEECPLPPTLTNLENCWIPPQDVITATSHPNPEVELSKHLQKEELDVKETNTKGDPDTEIGQSLNKSSEEEKVEVKFNKQSFLDIKRSEITKISLSSLEDRTELCESNTADQVLLPPAAVNVCSAEKDHVSQTKCTSLFQEMNVGFPPTEVPGGLETHDLKIQHERTLAIGEITEVNYGKTTQGSNYCSNNSKEGCEMKEVLKSTSEEDLEKHLHKSLKPQEHRSLQVLKSEESLEFKSEKKTSLNVEDLDNLNKLAVTQSTENNTSESGWSDKLDSLKGTIPSIQISAIEDLSDIKSPLQDLTPNEQFIIPKIEIMEPELKECILPLSILALNKPEPYNLQKHDATDESKMIIQDKGCADLPSLLPTLRGMQHNDDLSPTDRVKEVAQETLKQQEKHTQSAEQLPEVDYASIPVINVSCTDDLEGNEFIISNDSCTECSPEAPKESLFIVPPISVTCHESDSEFELSTPSDRVETETSAGTQRGTKQFVENNMTVKPEMIRSSAGFEEISEKSAKENTPAVPYETQKVGGNVPTFSKPTEDNTLCDTFKSKSVKDSKRENPSSVEDFLKSRPSVERLSSKPPTYPSLSPASLRKFMSKAAPELDNETAANVPVISVDDRQSDKADEDLSGGSTPTSSLSCESSPRLKRRDSLTLIRSATPEELASGARRKIFLPRSKEDIEGAVVGVLEGKKENPYMSPSQARRAALLQASTGQKTPPVERRSPLPGRRKTTLEVPKVVDEPTTGEPASTKGEEKPSGKTDPLKAPQVIRKIRGEPFPDASGHLKLWCQFFNVLSDSTIKWFKDEEEILEVKRSGGDETQVALAVVLASSQDCGVYGCTISNEHGTDTTDFLLSEDILSGILLKDDLEVGEEIEMTPLLFTKGLADSGTWGEKYFGRIFTETLHIGEGCTHKASRVKVIYGLDPVFESGSTCIMKVRNPIAYGTKQECSLAERNQAVSKQECKVQNMIREYCKIFAAESRVNENFGFSLEVIPRFLMYRPANSVPYATVEADLSGVFLKYCTMDAKGKLILQNTSELSELEQKCCTFQHWIHQWTHGNLLVTQLEGVETKITNVKVVTKSKGYQGLTECGSQDVFDQFLTYHQCNYYCGLLGLRPLKTADQSTKIKGSKSPLLNRRMSSSSPQTQRKGHSPQMPRKANSSPKLTKKLQEAEDNKTDGKTKPAESLSVPEMR